MIDNKRRWIGMPIDIVVEGNIDAAVMGRLLQLVGLGEPRLHIARGKGPLDKNLTRYNKAARHRPWFILRDLDDDAPCGSALVEHLVPKRESGLCLRIAVREIEAWLLADRANLASFLDISVALIEGEPEALANPKEVMIDLARRSKRRDLRTGMVPEPGSGRRVGEYYPSHVIEFATRHWSPERAMERAASLRRACRCLQRFAETGQW